jgi:acetylglutamate kinase
MHQRELLVIKCGGSIINNTNELGILLDNIAILKSHGFDIVIVHGGGPDINQLCTKLDIQSQFVNGNRVTSKEVLEVTQMALLGKVNCALVHKLNIIKVPSIGLSGHDVNLIEATFVNQNELGFVGQVEKINIDFIHKLLGFGITPVIAPIGVDNNGNCYNINADIIAGEIANVLNAYKLILLSDIDGFYRDFKDKNSLVDILTTSEISDMLDKNMISGGMIPKLKSCVIAVNGGTNSAHIINGNHPHGLISITSNPIGTTIIKGN